jgi:sialate O-acetylesterase
MTWLLACVGVALLAGVSQAAVELPRMFSDGMVLQRHKPAPIWGQAEPGAKVTAHFADQSRTTYANDAGQWRITFDGLEASAQARDLTVESGDAKKVIEDVLVGEVWVCSGQSNMVWPVRRINDEQRKIARETNSPSLRMFTVKRNRSTTPLDDVKGQWQPTTAKTVDGFSATAFFFGRALQRELDVPVGLITTAWGGTPIRAWTSRAAQQQVPALASELKPRNKKANSAHDAGILFNAMMHPWVGYGIRGFTWYQGESDTGNAEHAQLYDTQLATMINDWRTRWGDSELAFHFVQLPNFKTNRQGWAPMRHAMLSAHRYVPRTGMAITLDIGEADDIHPRNKLDVGERLARWARYQTYGQTQVVPSGPLPRQATRDGSQVVVAFDYAEGLMLKKPETGVFEVAGEDGQFVPARASIDNQTLLLHADAIDQPTAVRYAWQPNAQAALFNGEALPASPFEMHLQ